MEFEFTPYPDFNFLKSFAKEFGLPLAGNTLIIPSKMGSGSIRYIEFSPGFKLLFHSYTLFEDFVLIRTAPDKTSELVSMICYSYKVPGVYSLNQKGTSSANGFGGATIELSSIHLNSQIRFKAGTKVFFTVIGIMKPLLSELLHLKHSNSIVNTIMKENSSFLFHEKMWPEFQKKIALLALINEEDPLSNFYFRIRVQELIYLLFGKLLSRENKKQKGIKNSDVIKLYEIQSAIVTDLSSPPKLPELAKKVGMSETKMKALFKQIFGDSIYNYYQATRMEEAAFLLKHSDYGVSEIGFRLGFSNLSHFSRLFKKHYGMNPKRYSSV